jgi:hypothetical protein
MWPCCENMTAKSLAWDFVMFVEMVAYGLALVCAFLPAWWVDRKFGTDWVAALDRLTRRIASI